MIFDFVWQLICYYIGFYTLKIISLGRFDDRKANPMISLLGFFVLVALALVIYFILKD